MSTAEPTSPPVARPLPAGLRSLVRWVRAGVLVGAATLLVVPPLFWLNPGWVAAAGPAAAGLPLGSAFSVDPVARALGAAASLPGIVLGGWHDHLGLLTAAVLLAVATVMGEASRIAAENDGFV